VTAGVGTSTPTGSVTFYDGAVAIGGCVAVPLVAGVGVCNITYASTGNHHLTAAYSGSAFFLPSTSPPLGQTVTKCSKLAGCNLSGADLTNAQLAGADLKGANLSGATLIGTNLSGADLSGANLLGANLTDANLSGALTKGANFNGVVWGNTTCPDGTNSTADGGTCIGHL
jgi:uncharacterized protein YjbI with pentapeptide repeats